MHALVEGLRAERLPSYAPSTGPLTMLARGDLVGRYVVLAHLGHGGMGVVYAAYDPELDRKVALKLLLPQRDSGLDDVPQARLLREAQALARLAHPNVVGVHDVGTHHERIWIAMEFVAGQTLGAWAQERPRRWSEILAVLADVARGVAAAHAAGLVHRDLKPDNVMLDPKGRVRVMDFGLAHGRACAPSHELATTLVDENSQPETAALTLFLTRAGALNGTPAYMAPEQWRGHEASAAADQFGLSVMAWELLFGERPFHGDTMDELVARVVTGQRRPPPRGRHVPGWIRRVLERGLATAPSQRWPTMTALLTALERGRTRARARIAMSVLVGAAAIGSVMTGYDRWTTANAVAECEAQGASIAEVWNDETRTRLHDALLATGTRYAASTATTAVTYLDAQAAAWRSARTETCLDAQVRNSWDADILDRSMWCLDERQMELDALVGELSHADPSAAQHAVLITAGLTPVDPCRDEHRLKALPAPPDNRDEVRDTMKLLARTHALRAAGKTAEGLTAAREALSAAEVLAWPPLVAAAYFRQGELLDASGRYAEAEAALEESYFRAAALGALDTAAGAATGLIQIVGLRRARYDEAHRWFRHAEAALDNLGIGERSLERASVYTSYGSVLHGSGDYSKALEIHERALAGFETFVGSDHPYVATSLAGQALVRYSMGAYAEAAALAERALAIDVQEFGPDHPDVADTLGYLGTIKAATGDHDAAMPLYARALAIYEGALGPEHPQVASALNNLAFAHQSLGEYVQAKALYERGMAIDEKTLDPGHPDIAQALANLANLHQKVGEYTEAIALHEKALEIREAALGPEHPDVAQSLNNLASVHSAMKSFTVAQPLQERALAIWEKSLGPDHLNLAQALDNLALTLRSTGRPAEAVAPVERALAIRTKALGPNHPLIARSLGRLASLHFAAGAYPEARARHEQALALLDASAKPDEADLVFSLSGLARVALAEHQPAEAITLTGRVLQIRESGDVSPGKLAESRFLLAQALWAAPVDRGRDRVRAVALARHARDDLQQSQVNPELLTEVRGFLAAHTGR